MKLSNFLFLLFAITFSNTSIAQKKPLTYFLPDIEYDKNIPTPEEFLGFQPGEWHISHDKLVAYMKALADASDRVTVEEYAHTYENRPLLLLTITSKKNHNNLKALQAAHVALSDPSKSADLDISKMPIVVYQGFSIHGNEASGGNGAPLVAYYLAAGKSEEVENLLDHAIILLDPTYNPDGFNRFSTWVNMHKSKTLVTDPQSREFDEVWPRGRTNHYWFDLNRDWLPVQHPESQGRIRNFHLWKPNILTDHHEMGSGATFFFQPGISTRTNPFTPKLNQELTAEIGNYHAAALDKIGSLYYTQESFDDFYYGKGSTYPDVNGGIGILFEQASARGHLQQTRNGLLSFAFAIRNHVTAALSTQKAALEMRKKILAYQRDFYKNAMKEVAQDHMKAYLIGEKYDPARLAQFLNILLLHKIKVYHLAESVKRDGKDFGAESSYIVPLEQPQYRFIKALFEKMTSFQDSLFYDVSAWTLPLAFNLDYTALDKSNLSGSLLGNQLTDTKSLRQVATPEASAYAYLLDWDGYFAPKAAYFLLKNGLRLKVATKSFQTADGRSFDVGTILIPIQNQAHTAGEIHQLVQTAAQSSSTKIEALATGLTPWGIDMGSPAFQNLKLPKVMELVGNGVSSYDAGEVWHLLDQRYAMPLSMIETEDLGGKDLNKYNVIVLVDGSYRTVGKAGVEKLRKWVQNGGTLIASERAIRWVKANKLAFVKFKTEDKAAPKKGQEPRRPYAKISDDLGSNVIGGTIFETTLDLSHPLGYGFHKKQLPVFRQGTLFLEPAKNAYATPLIYTDNPLLSGYVSKKNLELIRNSAAIVVSGVGSGKVICMVNNPNFRAFWYGTNKLFANAIFFGNTINGNAVEKAAPAKNNQPD